MIVGNMKNKNKDWSGSDNACMAPNEYFKDNTGQK